MSAGDDEAAENGDGTPGERTKARPGPINELHGDQRGARKIKVEERAREIVELRASGVMPAELAERYGVTASRIRNICANYLKKNRARTAAELRDLYEKRYEDLIRPFVRDARGWTERHPEDHPNPDLRGKTIRVHPPDVKAAEFVLKATNELRRLQGLDKLVIEHEGAPPEEIAARITSEVDAYLKGVEDAKAAEGGAGGQTAGSAATEA